MPRFAHFVLAAALSLAAGLASAQDTRTITVSGHGQVETIPDMATIRLGVMEQDAEARLAMNRASEVAARLQERLTAMEVQERDVQTSQLTLNPVWSDRRGENGQQITGFVANIQVSVRVRDLDSLGDILGAVAEDGANRFGGLQFGLQNPGPVQDEARRRAVADAMARAELYAEAAGVTLGDVVSINEMGGGRPPQPMMMEMAAARDASVPISSGEVAVEAEVNMVFAIARMGGDDQ